MEKLKCSQCEEENSVSLNFCRECGYKLPKPAKKNVSPATKVKGVKKKNNKKTIGATVLGVLMFLVFYYATYLFFTPTYDEALGKMAHELNQTCPMMIDAETRLDNVGILPGNIIQYNYTMINMEQARVNTLELRNSMEPLINSAVKTDPELEFQRDNKTTMNYHYRDKNGSYLFLVSVTPDKY